MEMMNGISAEMESEIQRLLTKRSKCWFSFPSATLKLSKKNNFKDTSNIFIVFVRDGGKEWRVKHGINAFEMLNKDLKEEFEESLPEFPIFGRNPFPSTFSDFQIGIELENRRKSYEEYLRSLLNDSLLFSHPVVKKFLAKDLNVKFSNSSEHFFFIPSPDMENIVPETVTVRRNFNPHSNLPLEGSKNLKGTEFLKSILDKIVMDPAPRLSISYRISEQIPPPIIHEKSSVEKIDLFLLLREINEMIQFLFDLNLRLESKKGYEEKLEVIEDERSRMESSIDQLSNGKNVINSVVQDSDECKCNTPLRSYLSVCLLRVSACIEKFRNVEGEILEGVIQEQTKLHENSEEAKELWHIVALEKTAEDLVMEGMEAVDLSKHNQVVKKKERFITELKCLMMKQTDQTMLDRLLAIRDYLKSNFDAIVINFSSTKASSYRHSAPNAHDLE